MKKITSKDNSIYKAVCKLAKRKYREQTGKYLLEGIKPLADAMSLGIPVEIPVIQETTALGSAYMAALGLGDLSRIEDTIDLWHCHKRYEPGMSEDCRDALMDQWYRAVERSRGWITPNS